MRLLSWSCALVVLALAFAGCLQQGSDDDGLDHEATRKSNSAYGVEMNFLNIHDRVESGNQKVWAFQAENVGPDGDNPVEYNAACEGPFSVTVAGPGGAEVQPKEPQPSCEAIDMQTLRGGQQLDFPWSWDGTVWTEDGGTSTPASGVYTIRVTFTGFHDGNPDHVTDVWGETTVYVQGR